MIDYPFKGLILAALFCLPGCVSIVDPSNPYPPRRAGLVVNYRNDRVARMCCTLCERSLDECCCDEMEPPPLLKHIGCQLHRPVVATPAWMIQANHSVCDFGKQCFARPRAWVAKKSDWIEQKRAEANQPPWPRFHPVPTRPALAPNPDSVQEDPEIYGRFGKQP